MTFFEVIEDLPKFDLLDDLNSLNIEYKGNQICLNTTEDSPNDIYLGCGSLV